MKIAFLLGNLLQGLSSLSLAGARSPWGSLLPRATLPSHPPQRQLGCNYVSVSGPKATSVCLWLCLLSLNQGKFREQFKAAFSCCLPSLGPCASLKAPSSRSSASHKSLSLQSRCSVSKVSEHVLLTSVTTVLP